MKTYTGSAILICLSLAAPSRSTCPAPKIECNIQHQQPLEDLTSSQETYLNVTAILSSPTPPHDALIRCLRSPLPFTTYPTIGSSLVLSNTSSMTLVNLPASPDGEGEGWHNPPHPMWFVLLSGTARVWTPGDASDGNGNGSGSGSGNGNGQASNAAGALTGQEVLIEAEGERKNQIVLALDVAGRGHKTWYYGERGSTVMALQVPLAEGWEEEVDRWKTVREGPC